MIKTCALTSIAVVLELAFAPKTTWAQMDGRDYQPFAMIDGYERSNYKETRFDGADFPADSSGKTVHVEGYRYDLEYRPTNSGPSISELEVVRTLELEAKAPKWDLVYESGDRRALTVRSSRNGSYAWAYVTVDGSLWIYVHVIEEKPLRISIAPRA